ncbi:hypothetical protein [Blautia stercoris]
MNKKSITPILNLDKKTFRHSITKYGSITTIILLVIISIQYMKNHQIKDSTQTNQANQNGEIAELKKWDERNQMEQYTKVIYDGTTYTHNESIAEEQDVGACLAECVLQGLDEQHNIHKTTCSIYEIQNISTDCAIAAEFENGFYTYINYDYQPQTLKNFITDLNLENSLKILGCAVQLESSGAQEQYIYAENKVLLNVLVQEGDVENIADQYLEIVDRASQQYWIMADVAISVNTVGIHNVSISFDRLGYMSSNILGTVKAFYIGKKNVQYIINSLQKSGKKVDVDSTKKTDYTLEAIKTE